MRALLLAAGLGTLAMGAQTPTSVDALRSYRTWSLVTPDPIDMTPAIMVSCIGPSSWDSDPKNPHSPRIFRVFVNGKGRSEMRKAHGPEARGSVPRFPVGTMIVKEKFAKTQTEGDLGMKLKPGVKPELLTAMVKREKGFDSSNGDWEYLVLDGAMKRSERNEIRHCQSCHQSRKDRDYVFGAYGSLTR